MPLTRIGSRMVEVRGVEFDFLIKITNFVVDIHLGSPSLKANATCLMMMMMALKNISIERC